MWLRNFFFRDEHQKNILTRTFLVDPVGCKPTYFLSLALAKQLNINQTVLQRCNLSFFMVKTFKFFLENYRFSRKSGNDANSRGWEGGNAYENQYMIHPLANKKRVSWFSLQDRDSLCGVSRTIHYTKNEVFH